jgi:hypothetical protein
MDILVVNGGQWAATRTHALYDFYNTDQVEGMIQAYDVLPVRVLRSAHLLRSGARSSTLEAVAAPTVAECLKTAAREVLPVNK